LRYANLPRTDARCFCFSDSVRLNSDNSLFSLCNWVWTFLCLPCSLSCSWSVTFFLDWALRGSRMASRRVWFTASMVFAHDLNQLHRHHFGDDGSSHGEEGGGHGYAFEIEFHLSLS